MSGRIYGFEPVWRADAKVLILGTMPSVESLNRSFYYAHPRNAFWPILVECLTGREGARAADMTPEEKGNMLREHRVALWDSVGSCEREGSLDSRIREVIPNDFDFLYKQCPEIRWILFNGQTALKLYQRYVRKDEPGREMCVLPSTSPAYTLSYEEKKRIWCGKLTEVLDL